MKIAGIDQGTTSTRIMSVSENGNINIIHAIKHQQFYPQAGWVEHDPEELIKNIYHCIDVAGKIDAIGIDNQGESCLAWNAKTKQALSPVIVWQDNRTNEQIKSLKKQGLELEILHKAGLPLNSYFSASKLGWIIKNIPQAKEAYKCGELRMGTTDAFFLDRLSNHFVTDVSTASRTSLMNLKSQQWDKSLCEIFGVPIETLPKITSTTGDFGAIKTKNGYTPIVTSITDQQAALYGFGCRKSGEAKITFGTGAFAMMITGNEIHQVFDKGLLPTIAWQKFNEKPVFALDGGIYSAGAAMNWAKSLGLFSDFSEISNFPNQSAIEGGLAFVPALSGLACPHWNPNARGNWLGLSLDHNSKQLVQAILEGIAFRAAEVIDALNECVTIDSAILIDGGMSHNPYFTQFLADVSEREICVANIPELTGLGTIQLAADFMGHELKSKINFTTLKAKTNRRKFLGKFKQAIKISQEWNI